VQQASATQRPAQPQNTAAATPRPPATQQPAAAQPAAAEDESPVASRAPLIIPNTSGSALGADVGDRPLTPLVPESRENDNLEAVRRERAGPDQ
jgi:hypothetical protein